MHKNILRVLICSILLSVLPMQQTHAFDPSSWSLGKRIAVAFAASILGFYLAIKMKNLEIKPVRDIKKLMRSISKHLNTTLNQNAQQGWLTDRYLNEALQIAQQIDSLFKINNELSKYVDDNYFNNEIQLLDEIYQDYLFHLPKISSDISELMFNQYPYGSCVRQTPVHRVLSISYFRSHRKWDSNMSNIYLQMKLKFTQIFEILENLKLVSSITDHQHWDNAHRFYN